MNNKYEEWTGDLVAVYGSLREGLGNHRLIESCEKLSTERLHGFKMNDLGYFPAAFSTNNPEDSIVIEIYKVDEDQTKESLDALEGYRSGFYDRIKVSTSKGDAWIYIMDENKSLKIVEEGDWIEYYKSKKRM